MDNRDIILGLDSGTSVVKAVAFDLEGQQLGCASARNRYSQRGHGAALQSMSQTGGMPLPLFVSSPSASIILPPVWWRLPSPPGDGTGWSGPGTARSLMLDLARRARGSHRRIALPLAPVADAL